MRKIAEIFGHSLDEDDFKTTRSIIDPSCKYIIGDTTLEGPLEICNSYEKNMLAGRKKLDKLQWGKSRIEEIGSNQYIVHFTDYLTHKNKNYTHCCQQKLTINESLLISKIEHISDPEEEKSLKSYYQSVGL